MIRIFLLYAILIFAKKAPKMIMDLLNIKSEGVGLKGLNIKNKMGEAAIVGGAVKKGMTDIHGRARKGAAGFAAGLLNGKGSLKDRLKLPEKGKPGTGGSAFKGLMSGIASGGADARGNGENGLKGIWSKGWNDTRDVARGGQPTGKSKISAKFDKLNGAIASQGYSGLTTAHAKETEKFQDALSEKVGKDAAMKIMAALSVKHGVNGRIRFDQSDEYEAFKKDLKAITEAYNVENIKDILNDPNSILTGKAGYTPGGIAGMQQWVDDSIFMNAKSINEMIDNANIPRYGTSILFKKDLLTERGKQLDKIKNAYDSYVNLQQAGLDTTDVEASLSKLFNEATSKKLFDEYNEYGVNSVGLTLGYAPDANGILKINTLGDIDNVILKNTKQLKGTENDIQGMKAVEAEKPGSDKK